MIRGTCLCGALRYEVEGPFESMVSCHCSMCRKHHGAAFATFVSAPFAAFRWLSGEEGLSVYESSPGARRSFCRVCGSVGPMLLESVGKVFLPAGNLQGDLGIKPQSHFFTGSKAPWYEITDSLPQYAEYPPEYATPSIPRPAVTPKQGVTPGSCLCGDVGFEIEGTPARMFYCHCSRCRRARSAAHAVNMFLRTDQFRWLRGESHVRTYKPPDAQRFTVAFCDHCGGAVPVVRPSMVLVSAGSVDTDPGVRARAHIFVGSKASWFDITDSIAQYQELPPS